MTIRISLPVAIAILVIALGILGFAAYKYFVPERLPTDEKGNPIQVAPREAQPGFNAMQDIWKRGVQPTQPAPAGGGAPPQTQPQPR